MAGSQIVCLPNLTVGTGNVLRTLADEMESSPWGLLPAFPPVPIAAGLRASAVRALQDAVRVRICHNV